MSRVGFAVAATRLRLERLPFAKRVGLTFAAQIYNQVVTVAVQLMLVPLLLSAWGASRYGGWLLLYALPGYLTLSDFGFTLIAKNDMVMAAAAGRREAMLRVYHSAFALLLATTAIVGALAWTALSWVTLTGRVDLGPISERDGKFVIAVLIANVLANQFFLLLCAGVRASGRPAAEVSWGATARLLEGATTAVAAALSTDVTHAALAIVGVRLACIAAIWAWLRAMAPELRLGWRGARLAEIRAMAHPALSYSLLGLAQALAIQGPIVMLSALSGATATATFATLRTLARLGTSAANLVNYSVAPEYSRLYGARSLQTFARLERTHMTIGVLGVAAYALLLWHLGPWIVAAWTHGQIPLVHPFFEILILSVAAEMVWSAAFAPLSATNRHVRISYIFVGLTLAWVPLAYLGALSAGLNGVAAALLLLNGAMLVLLLWRAKPLFPS